MAEGNSEEQGERLGLDDAALAALPTVYAAGIFSGRTALISGGAGGIGRAISWLLARLGARVIVAGRDREKTDRLVSAICDRGYLASGATIDIRDADAVAAAFGRIVTTYGTIDLLVNSAGGQFPQAAIDFSIKGWNAVVNTNLNG